MTNCGAATTGNSITMPMGSNRSTKIMSQRVTGGMWVEVSATAWLPNIIIANEAAHRPAAIQAAAFQLDSHSANARACFILSGCLYSTEMQSTFVVRTSIQHGSAVQYPRLTANLAASTIARRAALSGKIERASQARSA